MLIWNPIFFPPESYWNFLYPVCRTVGVVMELLSSHTSGLWIVTHGIWERTKGSTTYPFPLNWEFSVSINTWLQTLIFMSLEECPFLLNSLFFYEKHVCSLCRLCKKEPLFVVVVKHEWENGSFASSLSCPCHVLSVLGDVLVPPEFLQINTHLAAFISTSLSHNIWWFFPLFFSFSFLNYIRIFKHLFCHFLYYAAFSYIRSGCEIITLHTESCTQLLSST